jgi:ABC-type branched-subunit amino acid transport system ATPase component
MLSICMQALLRQPAYVSRKEKLEYVDEVIKLLDMDEYADAIVGILGEGLNVEQRKKVTIGVELAAKPELLLFLDEPTSGLDSQTSWAICDLMGKFRESMSRDKDRSLLALHFFFYIQWRREITMMVISSSLKLVKPLLEYEFRCFALLR